MKNKIVVIKLSNDEEHVLREFAERKGVADEGIALSPAGWLRACEIAEEVLAADIDEHCQETGHPWIGNRRACVRLDGERKVGSPEATSVELVPGVYVQATWAFTDDVFNEDGYCLCTIYVPVEAIREALKPITTKPKRHGTGSQAQTRRSRRIR